MNITRLELLAADLGAERDFYAGVLELPVRLDSPILEVQVGKTQLLFTESPQFDGAYHFAFNIPENQFAAAKDWLRQRTPLVVSQSGQDEYNFESWNAHAVYFFDPAGNVVELIARHNLSNASSNPFGGHSLLNVSEISVTTANVLEIVPAIQLALNVEVYDGPSATFAAVGDEHGLFIVVPEGRAWFPDTGLRAGFYPLTVHLADGRVWSAPLPEA